MAIDMELTPKTKRPAGDPCCEPVVYPEVERDHAVRMAEVAKALGDPVRLQLVDVLRKHAGKVCVCELVPLFDLSQPTVSHHLKVLRTAGIVGSERQGLWAYYYVIPDALDELSTWLSYRTPAQPAHRPTSELSPPMASAAQAGGWRVAVSALGLITIVAYGVAYYSYGVLIDPIRADTGWSSAALGAVFSGALVIGGGGGLAGGRLVDRLGSRPAFLLAGTVGAGAIALASYQHDLLAFALLYATGCGVIAALGFYHVTQPAAIRVAPGAAERALMWLTILGAFASPIFLPLTAALVNAIGWRDTLRVLAAIAAAVFLATAAFGRGSSRVGRSGVSRTTVPDALRDAWAVPGFRRWVLASLLSGAAVDVILVYQVPVMIAAGLPIGAAATIGGVRGFAQLGGRVPLSPLLRRLGARKTIVMSFLTGAIGTLFLLASGHVAPAIAYSILAGASIGAMYTLQGIYTNDLVGQENLSLLMGAQQAVFAVGGAIGPVLAGTVFAVTNSYVAVVLLTAAGLLTSAVIMSTSGRAGRAPAT